MSLKYRRDTRTEEQFQSDIKNRTSKQRFLIDLFSKELKHRKVPHTIADYGVDNSGALVKGKVGCNADYIVNLDGVPYKVELQNSAVDKYCTYKVANLKKYVEDGVYILLFINTGFIDKNPQSINYETTRWAWISPDKISNMLLLEHYKEYKFGNKVCVRIYKKDFHHYFKEECLTHVEAAQNGPQEATSNNN
jgi:hypothetical protein